MLLQQNKVKQTLDLLSVEDVTLTAMGNKAMMKGQSRYVIAGKNVSTIRQWIACRDN